MDHGERSIAHGAAFRGANFGRQDGAIIARHWAELVSRCPSPWFCRISSGIKGVKESGPASTAIFGNLTPVWTGLFGWLILKEGWTAVKFLGAAIILGGVSMVSGRAEESRDASGTRREGGYGLTAGSKGLPTTTENPARGNDPSPVPAGFPSSSVPPALSRR